MWFLIPALNKKYSYMSVINGMLLQLWAPFSVFMYSVMVYDSKFKYYDYNSEDYEAFTQLWESYLLSTYWIGWGILLISIPAMKRF